MTKGKILVVDDNRINRDVLARRLRLEGYDVLTADSGRSALDTVEREEVSLMLLDMMMPEMDGIAVLEELRRTRGGLDLPVLVVSADDDTPQMVAALDLGANDYLTKPINFDLLLAKARRHLALSSSFSSTSGRAITLPNVKIGEVIGHYLLLDLIGEGGMGRVYRARDTRLLRDVALKVMAEGGLPSHALERFLLEARAVARISHPGVVTIYDVATDPLPYIAMELLSGKTIDSIPRNQVSMARAIHLVRQVLRALQAVHLAGVVHRDLKPANIMVSDGDRVTVMDFGLAKLNGEDLNLTQSGSVCGTPTAMAPEQLHPADYGTVDAQTDIFAVAVLLYDLVCGVPPFGGGSLPRLIAQILYKEVVHPQDVNPDISDELSQAILTGLRKKKEYRYKDCQGFLTALDGLDH
jgi:serine/threonine protein kinase